MSPSCESRRPFGTKSLQIQYECQAEYNFSVELTELFFLLHGVLHRVRDQTLCVAPKFLIGLSSLLVIQTEKVA